MGFKVKKLNLKVVVDKNGAVILDKQPIDDLLLVISEKEKELLELKLQVKKLKYEYVLKKGKLKDGETVEVKDKSGKVFLVSICDINDKDYIVGNIIDKITGEIKDRKLRTQFYYI